MLGKLLKHEFRATARVTLPMFAALLVLAVLGNLSTRMLEATNVALLKILGSLIIAAFGAALFAVCIMAVVIMVKRFHSNLLTNEGYLMFTLPVSVHSLVCSKIIVSVVWFIGTGLAVFVALLIVTFRVENVHKLLASTGEFFNLIFSQYSLDAAAISLELLAMLLLSGAAVCLVFYASLAVGYSFTNSKGLKAVIFFFVFQFATQFIGTGLTILMGSHLDLYVPPNAAFLWHLIVAIIVAALLLYCAVFYVITTSFLQKRLNLE